MSYSDFIKVYGDAKNLDFDKVTRLCKTIYQPDLSGGHFGDEDIDIFEFITNSLKKKDQPDRCLFHFFNHDGENDEEVHKCHILYCKILNSLEVCMVKLVSELEEPQIRYIWDEDNYFYDDPQDCREKYDRFEEYLKKVELESELSKYQYLSEEDIKNELITGE